VIILKTQTHTITQKANIQAHPEEVYEALTNAKIYSEFTRDKFSGVAKIGEKFTVYDISGKYLELEKGKRIVEEWVNSSWPKGAAPSKVELTFKGTPKGTEVTLVQSNLPMEVDEDYLLEGWTEYFWDRLNKYFSKQLNKK
jgi:uncharacterized protein YndB with AHSA1/START domain